MSAPVDRCVCHVDRKRAPALQRAINSVLGLHHPRTLALHVDVDCTTESCDHDGIAECPTYAARVCAHCQTLGDSQSEWETFLNEQVMWPCPTVRALGWPIVDDSTEVSR